MTKIHAVSINARGLQTKGVFENLLRKIKRWSTKEATRHHIYLIQELEHIDTMADLVISVVAQIPRDIITEISKPHMVQLKEDKLAAAITDSGHLRYGRCKLA